MKYMLSVIIPVFNNFSILDKIKDKIMFLSKEQYQIIIIDDFSSDCTYNQLKEFICMNNFDNVELYQNDKNYGPSYSRNVGIKKSNAEYIAFLDSDDDWHLKKLIYKFIS